MGAAAEWDYADGGIFKEVLEYEGTSLVVTFFECAFTSGLEEEFMPRFKATLFHPQEVPWFDPDHLPPVSDTPVLMWEDDKQTWIVYKGGKIVALCEDGLSNMQGWWNWMEETYFGKTDKP
jgi:hypothetical protein